MKLRSHPYLWLALMLLLTISIGLWLYGQSHPHSPTSPLPTPVAGQVSPLPTPASVGGAAPPPTVTGRLGAALLWVALGILAALLVAAMIARLSRRSM